MGRITVVGVSFNGRIPGFDPEDVGSTPTMPADGCKRK